MGWRSCEAITGGDGAREQGGPGHRKHPGSEKEMEAGAKARQSCGIAVLR